MTPVEGFACTGTRVVGSRLDVGHAYFGSMDDASNEDPITEWAFQKRLIAQWLDQRSVELSGEQFFLAAWEVMTDYRINDAHRHWSLPSIDFLFLDRSGHMVALELKRSVGTPREAWHVLCQVTHRAHRLAENYGEASLEAAYRDCHLGLDGRRAKSGHVADLRLAHARAFDQPPLVDLPGVPVRRIVIAKTFGPSFDRVVDQFTAAAPRDLEGLLRRYSRGLEFDRFLALPRRADLVDPAPVLALHAPAA